jgi:phosphatidylinositol alpha-1,6-mannosyltransferase
MSGTGAAGARAGRTPVTGRPRLLLLTTDYPPSRGGIQTLSLRLAEGLDAFDTHVLAPTLPGAAAFDAARPTAVSRSPAPARIGTARNAVLNAYALREAHRLRPALTLSMHVLTSPAAAGVAATVASRTVQYYHAQEIPHRPRLAAFAARRAHANVVVSDYTAGLLEALGAPARTLTRIPPGVEVPADGAPLPAERPTILTVARLVDRYKGHDVLARALVDVRRVVRDVQWVVIGEGPLRGELEALVASLGVADAVRFLGAVGDGERDEWLRRASVFAMPSRLPGPGRAGEGFGIAFLEAAAYGLPVVAGNVAGALDSVADGTTGLLVDPTDPRAVAGAVTRVLTDEGLAARLGTAGAARAREFAWPVIVRRVQDLLLETLYRA